MLSYEKRGVQKSFKVTKRCDFYDLLVTLLLPPAPHPAGWKLGSFSWPIPPQIALSHDVPVIKTKSKLGSFGHFSTLLGPPVGRLGL